jgi:hypothetical protein
MHSSDSSCYPNRSVGILDSPWNGTTTTNTKSEGADAAILFPRPRKPIEIV